MCSHFVAVAGILCLSMPGPGLVADGPIPDRATVRECVIASQSAVTSLEYRSECLGESHFPKKEEPKEWTEKHLIAPGMRFMEIIHADTYLPGGVDLAWGQHLIVGSFSVSMYPFNRIGATNRNGMEVQSGDSIWGGAKIARVYRTFYLECTGWWPFPIAPGDRSHLVQSALGLILEEPTAIIGASFESVRGTKCIVVECTPIRQRLWLARDMGYALVRREIEFGQSGRTVVYDNDRFEEVLPGTWMPTHVSRSVYRARADANVDESGASEGGQFVERNVHRLQGLVANRVSPDAFRIHCPPGSIITDARGAVVRRYGGGEDFLDESVQFARSALALAETDSPPRQAKWTGAVHGWQVVVVIMVVPCGLLIGYKCGSSGKSEPIGKASA